MLLFRLARLFRVLEYLKNVLTFEQELDLRPLGAVLGRSWTLFSQSCAAPGAYVAGLGPLLAPMLAV